jgi:branched-chain amino acid transport system substrate-binding protein
MKEHRLSARLLAIVGLAGTLAFSCSAWAQKAYGTGAYDSGIRFGQTMSYSGPNSAFSVLGKVAGGYFRKVNDEGGINGRKLHFISYDDAYNPAKTIEQTRRLVESDDILFTFGSLRTSLQLAVQKYLNTKKVPQLFVLGPSSRWEDYEALSLDDRINSFLSERGKRVCTLCAPREAGRKDRGALSE